MFALTLAAPGFSLAATTTGPRLAPVATTPARLPIHLRGGAASASLANFAGDAAGLFANMGGASAFIAGGLVPLSTFAAPGKPTKDDSPLIAKLKRAHGVVSAASMLSLLCAVMYATISTNKLKETAVASTVSLKALLTQGDFALPWTGCNSHFILGLYGFATTVGLNVWINYGGAVGKAVSCLVAGAVLLMVSIVNDAVAAKAADGARIGGSVLNLLVSYLGLLLQSIVQGKRLLVFVALGFFTAGAVLAGQAVLGDED